MRAALAAVQAALADTEQLCAAFRQQFDKYAHLWQSDMHAALQNILASGGSDGSGAQKPSLEAFAAEIGRYKAIQDEVQALPASAALGWVKVDARPLKQALLTWTSKWTHLFMRHLHGQVRRWGSRLGLLWHRWRLCDRV